MAGNTGATADERQGVEGTLFSTNGKAVLTSQTGLSDDAERLDQNSTDNKQSEQNVKYNSAIANLRQLLNNTGTALSSAFAPFRPYIGKAVSWFRGVSFTGTPDTVRYPHGYSDLIDYRAADDKYVDSGITETADGDFQKYTGLTDTGFHAMILESNAVSADTILMKAQYVRHDDTLQDFNLIRRTAAGKIEWADYQPPIPATETHDIQRRVNMDYPTTQAFHGLSSSQDTFELEFDKTALAAANIRPDEDLEFFADMEYVVGSEVPTAFSMSHNFLDAAYDDNTHLPNTFDWEDLFNFNYEGNIGTIQHRIYDSGAQRRYAFRLKPNTGGRQSDFLIRVRAGLTPYLRYYEHTSNAVAESYTWHALQDDVGDDHPADTGTLRFGYQMDLTTDGVHSTAFPELRGSNGTFYGVDAFDFSHLRVRIDSVSFNREALGRWQLIANTQSTLIHRSVSYINGRAILGIREFIRDHWDEKWFTGLIPRIQNPDQAEIDFDIDITSGHKLKSGGEELALAKKPVELYYNNAGDTFSANDTPVLLGFKMPDLGDFDRIKLEFWYNANDHGNFGPASIEITGKMWEAAPTHARAGATRDDAIIGATSNNTGSQSGEIGMVLLGMEADRDVWAIYRGLQSGVNRPDRIRITLYAYA